MHVLRFAYQLLDHPKTSKSNRLALILSKIGEGPIPVYRSADSWYRNTVRGVALETVPLKQELVGKLLALDEQLCTVSMETPYHPANFVIGFGYYDEPPNAGEASPPNVITYHHPSASGAPGLVSRSIGAFLIGVHSESYCETARSDR